MGWAGPSWLGWVTGLDQWPGWVAGVRNARLPNELQFTCYSSKWIIIHCYCSSELKCKGEKRRLTSGLLLLKMKTLLLKVKTKLRAVGAIPLFCSPYCVLFSLLSWLSHCLSPSVLFSLYWFRSSVFFICVRSPFVFCVRLFGGGDGATGDEAGVRVLADQCFSPFHVFFSSFSCSLYSLFFSFSPSFLSSSSPQFCFFFVPVLRLFFCSPPPSRGRLCSAFIEPAAASVVVTAGLLNAP